MNYRLILVSAIIVLLAISTNAKRIITNIDIQPSDTIELSNGTFVVSTDACHSCNNGYSLDQIEFLGFDKTLSSKIESFFISNNTDCILESVTIEIEYLTLDSRQLHKRYEQIFYTIPPGETRKIDIKSWDKQKSFYYHLSAKPRRQATPFTVRIIPLSCTLRFP